MFQGYILKNTLSYLSLILLILNFNFPKVLANNIPTPFVNGVHFKELSPKSWDKNKIQKLIPNDSDTKQVYVFEFFGYWCHHCQKLQPFVHDWAQYKKPEHTVFYRIPMGINNLSKAYYVADELNKLTELDKPIFTAIHEKRIDLNQETLLKNVFLEHGVNDARFDEVFNSFEIDRKVRWGVEISRAFKVMATPIVVVYGKEGTYVTDLELAGNEESLVALLPTMIEKARGK